MPGLLREDACCPKCGEPIEALAHTISTEGVTAEYFHSKGSPKARRKRRCMVVGSPLPLEEIRRRLEVPAR